MSDTRIPRAARLHGLPVLQLEGDLDCYSTPALKTRLQNLIENGDTDLILNLNQVDFVDSVGLGMLVAVHRQCIAQGGSLRVLCTNRNIWRIFDITGLQRAFPVYRDELALAASLDAK
jgi:anti-sigma B factor antagonist